MRSNRASTQLESAPVVRHCRDSAGLAADSRARQSGTAATAFNPAISLILGGSYTDTSQDPETWSIGGFIPSGGEVGPGERSFNLGESELTLSANVDPYFSAKMIAAITAENEIEVEEAYFRTLALPSGFTAKGGRFFSGFGYLNEVHAHAWDFVDQPLVYQAFFGGQYKQDGVQVKWLAPTDLFVELGAETGNGDAFPATRRNRNGMNGATLFAHVGGDVGDSTSWRAGAAWIDQRAEDRAFEDVDEFGEPVINSFTGKSRTWVVDAVLKWTPYGDVTAPAAQAAGRVHASRKSGAAHVRHGRLGPERCVSQRAVRLVCAGRVPVPAALARGRCATTRSTPVRRSIALVDLGPALARAFPALLAGGSGARSRSCSTGIRASSPGCARNTTGTTRAREGDRDRVFRLQYIYGIGAHGAHKY